MKRVVVRLLVDDGNASRVVTDFMPDEEAEALRDRVEKEHSEAGTENRWIRVGRHSIQSRQIQTISVEAPRQSAPSAVQRGEPIFRRDMNF